MSTTRKRKAESVPKATRAPLACERCRVKKLRCSGGYPCRSCLNASAECDFEVSAGRTDRLGGVDLSVRVTQLEKAVADLQAQVHGLSGPAVTPAAAAAATHIPTWADTTSPLSGISGQSQQRADETSASRFLAITLPTNSGVAPFPALMHHPSIWENRSRSPSLDAVPLGRTEYTAKAGSQDDPVSTGLIDEVSALSLFQLFMERCHVTFPVMRYEYEDLHRKSPFLFTCVLAVASRYYLRYQQVNPSLPVIEATAITAIKDLAYSHLGASMFRKQPGVMDVQAVLLLANWNLFGQGMSPDNWLVSGHCGRLAYRIGLDRIASYARDRPVLCRWRAWLGWNMQIR
ncbi:hypothetical protein CspeluHIS016_0212140 [Cutaneotrichosporon spelunceum]|uniref:Zn(2)-C6 fungal-type domain-containing protein n=1 Tax=Cutaneotrichosporon spelunceum TaxID=1672016 RepID=A0AAD3TSM2_9TREE|nr:hypothetical protein CspeluHIS016_0212140 [Cutaneotrichosporon spelunceum]